MCTIALAWQTFTDSPVIVAANRDEQLDRPAEPPTKREWGASVVAPADRRKSGTWIGYNEHGVLVAITNRWDERDVAGERSRGLLVRDALGSETAEDAIRHVEREIDERSYEGFNLLAVDEYSALLVEHDGIRQIQNLDPGVHVIVNVGADGRYEIPESRADAGRSQAANAEELLTALTPEPGEDGVSWLSRTSDVIADHSYGVCIHGDGFGTRSSSLIRMGAAGVSYRYADGPPCETDFEQVSVEL